MDVAAEPVELGDDDRGLVPLGELERLGELRPPIEGVAPLAGLDLAEGFDELEPFSLGKAGERRLLRFEAEAERPWLAVDTRV